MEWASLINAAHTKVWGSGLPGPHSAWGEVLMGAEMSASRGKPTPCATARRQLPWWVLISTAWVAEIKHLRQTLSEKGIYTSHRGSVAFKPFQTSSSSHSLCPQPQQNKVKEISPITPSRILLALSSKSCMLQKLLPITSWSEGENSTGKSSFLDYRQPFTL